MVPRNRKESAFTLLEMLAAMGLMSVLAGSLYASLHIGFRARDSAVAALEPVRTAELTIELLREDIESVLPPTGILAGEFIGQDAKDDSQRDADTLLFHSSANDPEEGEKACDIRRVEFVFASLGRDRPSPEGTERVLVRRITTNLLAPETVEPKVEILFRRVLAFNLRYFDGFDWYDDWDSTLQGDVLPLGVEVVLEVERSAGEQPAATGYRLSRVFLLPCGRAAEDGIQVIRPSSW